MTKRTGKLFILLAIVLFILFSFIGGDFPKVLSIIAFLLTMSILFTGITILFIESSKEKRKKAAWIILFFIAFVLTAGLISRYYRIPGASIEIVSAFFLAGFTYFPLIIINRYEKWVSYTRTKGQALLLSLADMASALFISVGLLAKWMHWPGAAELIVAGAALMAVAMWGWNALFKKEVKLRKQAEDSLSNALQELNSSHHQLQEKQKEILESISYAKRLQEAILPPQEFINAHLPDNFIIYEPKDLVAGDFYWAEFIAGKFFIAAADSTGHGVPGAMVSVVCSNALNRAVKEFGMTETGKILDKARELVLETFIKSTSEVKDGMDISLLCIDAKTKTAFWSGANNPLWYVQDGELKEIKANKQPVGKTEYPSPFTTHPINYTNGTMFYLFTDGLADQFGGPKGKKFKYKQFSDLLTGSYALPLSEQSVIISKAFASWKGDLEQVDDVCVIGVRV